MSSCDICTETFNVVVHKRVTCAGCDHSACRKCIETYFISSPSDYQCMHCHKLWDDEFVKTNLTQANVKRLKAHRENVLLDREKTWMPETQQHVIENIRNEKLRDLNAEIWSIRGMLRTLLQVNNQFEKETAEELKAIHNLSTTTHTRYTQKLSELQIEFNKLRSTNPNAAGASSSNRNKGYVSEYILKCSNGDCKGFVGTNMKCRLCEVTICKTCHEIKDEAHTCKPEDIQTASLIKESTRPCPKCATRIHRISGCTQMWCTQCNTSFDYRTGDVYTRNIHNPHYFEWLRRNPGEAEEPTRRVDGCLELSLRSFLAHVRTELRMSPEHSNTFTAEQKTKFVSLSNICRNYYHIIHLIRNYAHVETETQDAFQRNLNLRIAWMRNKIDDKQFKTSLQRREKHLQTDLRRHQVLTMVSQIVREQCVKILNSEYNETEWNTCLDRFENIVNYGEECFERLSKIYKMKMPVLRVQ
jgi:hypothetical protein